jgi:hypothetical protein
VSRECHRPSCPIVTDRGGRKRKRRRRRNEKKKDKRRRRKEVKAGKFCSLRSDFPAALHFL